MESYVIEQLYNKIIKNNENYKNKLSSGIPIAALMVDNYDCENKIKSEVNDSEKTVELSQEAHAEYKILIDDSHFGEANSKNKNKYTLYITSFPCEHCMNLIKERSHGLKIVYFISDLSKENKIADLKRIYNIDFNDLYELVHIEKINLYDKNTEDLKDKIKTINEIGHEYMVREYISLGVYGNFIFEKEELNTLTISRDEYKRFATYFKFLSKETKRTIVIKNDGVRVSLEEIRKGYYGLKRKIRKSNIYHYYGSFDNGNKEGMKIRRYLFD